MVHQAVAKAREELCIGDNHYGAGSAPLKTWSTSCRSRRKCDPGQ
jgi:hypothetical protein